MKTLKKLQFEVKSEAEAMSVATHHFKLNPNYIKLDIVEKKGMFGLKKSYDVTASVDVDLLDLGYGLLRQMLEDMGIKADVSGEVDTETQTIAYTIESPDNPLLIGRGGKTLEGIQFYLRNVINLYTEERTMVVLDIGGYKENRRRQLEILATKTAKEVARTGVATTLKPMNAYERRIVHTKLADWRDVSTVSEGETPNRYLVIRPKKR